MDIGISRASSSLIKVHDLINSYKFTSDMLSNVKVSICMCVCISFIIN